MNFYNSKQGYKAFPRSLGKSTKIPKNQFLLFHTYVHHCISPTTLVYSVEIYKNNSIARAKDKNGTLLFLIKFIGSGWSSPISLSMLPELQKRFKYTSTWREFSMSFSCFFMIVLSALQNVSITRREIAFIVFISMEFFAVSQHRTVKAFNSELNLPAINFNGFGLLSANIVQIITIILLLCKHQHKQSHEAMKEEMRAPS